MDLTAELESCFQFINLTLNEKVMKKCVELCKAYEVEPEDFVNIWCAFAASKMCTDPPTLEQLDTVERKELQKYSKDKPVVASPARTPKIVNYENERQGYNKQDLQENSKNKNIQNSDEIKSKIQKNTSSTELLDESISSQLSSNQESIKYSQRTNSLSVRLSIGNDIEATFGKNREVKVNLFREDSLNHDAKYMYEVLGSKASCLNNITNWIGTSIAKKNNLVISDEVSTKYHIGPIITYGKIVVDGDGHLNLQSIMLEGTTKVNSGHCVHLNVDKLSKIALFPGQVVVVKGKMLSGNKLIAENIYSDATCDLPVEPPVTDDSLRIIVAAGPYTLNENLNYDPMRDLLNYVADNEPHVLILMGPFLDDSHPTLSTGDIPETFDSFFETLIESMSAALQDTGIQIIIVSSMKDLHHHNIYPTPPYKTRENHSNIKFFPDPCILKINGLVVGITTVDVMYHIAKEELVTAKNTDTMSRLASHMTQQHSFYPLYPPNPEVNVSHQFLESYGLMECLPHMMILPSTFRGFIRKINECVVLNPERLTRGNGGGAFADITIASGVTRSISSRINCKVLNI